MGALGFFIKSLHFLYSQLFVNKLLFCLEMQTSQRQIVLMVHGRDCPTK